MKRILLIGLAALLLLSLCACAGEASPLAADSRATPEPAAPIAPEAENTDAQTEASSPTPASTPEPEAPQEEPEQETEGKKVLVAFFSATGTTKGVAERIAKLEDADLYEIVPAEPYTSEDLNYNDRNSRSTREQYDQSARPEIAGDRLDISGYERIYVGYPIWWGEEPRILDTFVENYDFGSAVLVPFCTSGGSGIGRSGENLAEKAGSGDWRKGKRFSGNVGEDELQSWIDDIE